MILRLLHEFATTKSWLNQPRAVGWPSSFLFLHGSHFYQFLRAQPPWSTAVGMAHPNRPQGIFLASGTPRIFDQSYPKFPRFQGVGFRNPPNSFKNSPKQSDLWFIFFKNRGFTYGLLYLSIDMGWGSPYGDSTTNGSYVTVNAYISVLWISHKMIQNPDVKSPCKHFAQSPQKIGRSPHKMVLSCSIHRTTMMWVYMVDMVFIW